MQEEGKIQQIPVKMYRTPDRLMVAAPMPGMEPGDILVEITENGVLILHGALRGVLKDITKELLMDEWSVGDYHRELKLPDTVDGEHANVTYGNGVLVVAMPTSDETYPGRLTLQTVSPAHGEHMGNVGHRSE
jgi:HSP20 family protein